MLHLIACRFKREENTGWEKGFIVTTDIDGQDLPGHIITSNGSIYPDTLTDKVYDIRIDHHNGHYHLDFEH